jgi:hypothetical protein
MPLINDFIDKYSHVFLLNDPITLSVTKNLDIIFHINDKKIIHNNLVLVFCHELINLDFRSFINDDFLDYATNSLIREINEISHSFEKNHNLENFIIDNAITVVSRSSLPINIEYQKLNLFQKMKLNKYLEKKYSTCKMSRGKIIFLNVILGKVMAKSLLKK